MVTSNISKHRRRVHSKHRKKRTTKRSIYKKKLGSIYTEFTLIQHNIGRQQDVGGRILHADANTNKFRRTVYNYIYTQYQYGRKIADVYTLQEVALPINISPEYPITHTLNIVYYSPECRGLYLWYRPHLQTADTFCFLSFPFKVANKFFQYVYVNTSEGLIYSKENGQEKRHFHGVAVAYNLQKFKMLKRPVENSTESTENINSIYNVLIETMYQNKNILFSVDKHIPIRVIKNHSSMHIPKHRFTPVMILQDHQSGSIYGFISYHGKIVNLYKHINELNVHHNPLQIKKQLSKNYPVYMGADINVDLTNLERYFSKYGRGKREHSIFIRHFEKYKSFLKDSDIHILPKDGVSSRSTDDFKMQIDYFIYKDLIPHRVTVNSDNSYMSKSADVPLMNDFDHLPMIMKYNYLSR